MSDCWRTKTICEDFLDTQIMQPSDSERCDSRELDDEIRILIGKNSASKSCKKTESSSCILNAFGKCSLLGCSEQMESSNEFKKASDSHLEHKLGKKLATDMLEQQIISLEKQKQELLAVNNQWDLQFRKMKQQYEKKVTEMKAKLEAMQKTVSTLERERDQIQQECERLEILNMNRVEQEMQDKKTLQEENRLLKEEIALGKTKKIHYEYEISRLNKVLVNSLRNQHAVSHEPRVDATEKNCSEEEMKVQIDVLRQQVQIYEEDFKKERSDRERLNAEKEALQRINEKSQTQLNKLNYQIKDCQEKKELLEKQVKQQAQDLQALTEKHGFSHQLFVPPFLSCSNCGSLHLPPQPQKTFASHGFNREQQGTPACFQFRKSTLQSTFCNQEHCDQILQMYSEGKIEK
uniref:TNFAIP3-interacting protein 3 isoform X2 n=1 Tax=Pogona vitticeps TaxID=103695 RepID=A0ABM5GJM2_9SAUR